MQFLTSGLFIMVLYFPAFFYSCEKRADQMVKEDVPNIIWLVTEDNSKHFLRLYDEGGAPMPNVESLANKGVVFDRAFSNAPVCSVARSALISGCYGPRIGAQYHRRMKLVPLPDELQMFPFYLKEAGYYTTNNNKEDYNIQKGDNIWDESSGTASYKNKKAGQPFFHVQNFGITHEGKLHFDAKQMAEFNYDLSGIKPFPYHPETEIFRKTYAHYYQLHMEADEKIGDFLKQLEKDGLMENTIIFYFGDHGGVLPRSKGYVYESGLHVPLVVYVPDKWKQLIPFETGTRTDAFVEFIDFGPTVLNLAGIRIPKIMDGVPFMGKNINPNELAKQNSTFSYADRFDEKYDMVRALRKGKYKYIRNYQPFNMDGLYNFYRYKMLAYQEWEELYQAGQLNKIQEAFFERRRPEALYDLEKDPHETLNLIDDINYKETAEALRKSLRMQVKDMPDLGFFPEPYFLEKGIENPVAFGEDHKNEISRLVDIADLAIEPFGLVEKEIEKALGSNNPWERYWGLIVCSSFGSEAKSLSLKARETMQKDPETLVRIRAVEFLVLSGSEVKPEQIIDVIKRVKTESEAALVLNTIALIKTLKPSQSIQIPDEFFDPSWTGKEGDLVSRRIQFINHHN